MAKLFIEKNGAILRILHTQELVDHYRDLPDYTDAQGHAHKSAFVMECNEMVCRGLLAALRSGGEWFMEPSNRETFRESAGATVTFPPGSCRFTEL